MLAQLCRQTPSVSNDRVWNLPHHLIPILSWEEKKSSTSSVSSQIKMILIISCSSRLGRFRDLTELKHSNLLLCVNLVYPKNKMKKKLIICSKLGHFRPSWTETLKSISIKFALDKLASFDNKQSSKKRQTATSKFTAGRSFILFDAVKIGQNWHKKFKPY